jgi:hypothetical protein
MAPSAMKAPARDGQRQQAEGVELGLLDADCLGLFGDRRGQQGVDAVLDGFYAAVHIARAPHTLIWGTQSQNFINVYCLWQFRQIGCTGSLRSRMYSQTGAQLYRRTVDAGLVRHGYCGLLWKRYFPEKVKRRNLKRFRA